MNFLLFAKYFGICTDLISKGIRFFRRVAGYNDNIIFNTEKLIYASETPKFVFVYFFGPLVHAKGALQFPSDEPREQIYAEKFIGLSKKMQAVKASFQMTQAQRDPNSFMFIFGDHGVDVSSPAYVDGVDHPNFQTDAHLVYGEISTLDDVCLSKELVDKTRDQHGFTTPSRIFSAFLKCNEI